MSTPVEQPPREPRITRTTTFSNGARIALGAVFVGLALFSVGSQVQLGHRDDEIDHLENQLDQSLDNFNRVKARAEMAEAERDEAKHSLSLAEAVIDQSAAAMKQLNERAKAVYETVKKRMETCR